MQSLHSTSPSSESQSTWSSQLNDRLFPILLPFQDPVGTYYTIYNSVNMGIFGGKQFAATDIPDLSGKIYLVTGGKFL